jgi:hypothetical protein
MKKSHHSPNEVRDFPARRYKERRHWLDSIKIASGCVVCGVAGPAEILTFDHVRGEKLFNIGQSWNQGRAALEAEIAKCDILCANCHNIKTKASQEDPPFIPFPKIARLNRDIVISEKIDGTNATVWVDGEGDVWAGSRTRWLTRIDDNFGFAEWVECHAAEFAELGPAVIRGEWYGSGIQRGYGLNEKRFAVFNPEQEIPSCCSHVPVLYSGPFGTVHADNAVAKLRANGSLAAPGFMKPEGIVIFHTASSSPFKVTLEKDEAPKGVAAQ